MVCPFLSLSLEIFVVVILIIRGQVQFFAGLHLWLFRDIFVLPKTTLPLLGRNLFRNILFQIFASVVQPARKFIIRAKEEVDEKDSFLLFFLRRRRVVICANVRIFGICLPAAGLSLFFWRSWRNEGPVDL